MTIPAITGDVEDIPAFRRASGKENGPASLRFRALGIPDQQLSGRRCCRYL
jgi:hypothetical protein